MPRKRKREPWPDWTPEDDAKLREMVTIGLSVDYYKLGLPHRHFGDILDRRLTLGIPRAKRI